MARAVVRVMFALAMFLAAGLMLAPLLWSSGAQSQNPAASRASQTLPFPTISVPRVTTTVGVATTPPLSSGVSTTPTTRNPTSPTRPRVVASTTTTAPTTTTSTTVAPIPAPAPAPVTLPLATAAQSGSIGSFFPIMSGIGLVSLVGLLSAQWFLTKPGRKGPTL